MAVTIGSGILTRGGAVVETSGGTKYAVFVYGTLLKVYKDIDGTPSVVGSQSPTTIFGGGSLEWVHAAIDSADDIHIVCSGGSLQTRDISYCIFDCGTDTFGAWEQAADYTSAAPIYYGCAISLDSNGKPRVLYVNDIKTHGTNYDQIQYTDKTGAAWSTPELVCPSTTKNYFWPRLTCCPANDVEAFYFCQTDGDPTYRRRNATWNTAAAYAESWAIVESVLCTAADSVFRYHRVLGTSIEENNSDTGYDSFTWSTPLALSSALVGTDRYVFYQDGNNDVHLISNSGAGWVDEGAKQIGTYNYVIAEWAYNFENQSGEINYIFDDGTNVYYDSFSLGPPPEGQPMRHRIGRTTIMATPMRGIY